MEIFWNLYQNMEGYFLIIANKVKNLRNTTLFQHRKELRCEKRNIPGSTAS